MHILQQLHFLIYITTNQLSGYLALSSTCCLHHYIILHHPASKVTVQLTSSDGSFTTAQLEAMTITLPNYTNGATINNGIFVAGTGKGDITVAPKVGDDGKSAIAIFQPQTIA